MDGMEYKDYLILEASCSGNDGYTIEWAKKQLKDLFNIDFELEIKTEPHIPALSAAH
jgi:hypothetical protein